ncbi:MAG: hypothetical protein ACRDNY_05630 [Gaiellaceae bacterium]
MPRCLKWGEERRQECTEYRDEGYNKCSDWDEDCCDWWPCSWGCKLITWVCVAWYWVSNVVCVAWTWITTVVCLVWDVVTTVVNVIIETLESILGWVLSFIAALIEIIFAIPILGRLIKWIWNVVLTAVWGLVGLVDAVFGLIGVRPEKKLRLCVVVIRDEKGVPVAQPSDVVPHLQNAIDIFREEANVRVIPSAPFQYDSAFADDETATEDWVHVPDGQTGSELLDVDCGAGALGEDLWLTGTDAEILSMTQCFYGKWRRVVGYGAPIVVIVTREVGGPSRLGCSLGPLSDYVTIEGGNPICLAHELGHACNLWHVDGATNLMNSACGGTQLDWWQVLLLRDSRHVTYF